jgi:homoserine kinase
MEGHPDNVAAALLGGFSICVSSSNGGGLRYTTIPVPAELRAVLFIPHFRLSTERAREVLPVQVSRRDAVYNIGRASLLVAGLTTGRLDILRVATEDRLHQPYRESLFPAAKGLFAAALEAGALGVFLSGAGPTILALVSGNEEAIAARFEEKARDLGIAGRTLVVDVCQNGATVIEGEQNRPEKRPPASRRTSNAGARAS